MLEYLGYFLLWSFVGLLGWLIIFMYVYDYPKQGAIGKARGIEFLNPLHIYKHNRVNWFGAFMVAILYNLICPGMSVYYWVCKFIYFICTVGRKR